MNFYPEHPRARKLKAEGIRKRAALLALVPTEFTAAQLCDAAGKATFPGMTQAAANAQIQKMVRWHEITPTSAYQKPRKYRKAS